MRTPFALALVAGFAASAAAQETVTFTAVDSQASSGVASYNATLAGGYGLGSIDWDGLASPINGATWGSELRLNVSGPLGAASITLGSGNTYGAGTNFFGSQAFGGGADPAGNWTFDFYESFDDGGDAAADATWDTIDLNFVVGGGGGLTLDDLSLANIGLGSSITGNNGGSADELNGPNGFGTGSWSGGDDVYTLNWGGGDMTASLDFLHGDGDLDLIVWGDNGATSVLGTSTSVSDNEEVSISGLAAGTYYVHVDGWQGASADYGLRITPTPGAAGVLALAGIGLIGRRRR